jgi:dTDP-4-dehydrorhamnose 3,5-epimerase
MENIYYSCKQLVESRASITVKALISKSEAPVKITETPLKGCFVLEPRIFEDERGLFYETYRKERFQKAIGRDIDFVQDNHSVSKRGVLRGLHLQTGEYAQSKLVRVVQGEVLDVIVDLRKDSPTFGKHYKTRLSGKNSKILFIPKGMAHGFLTLSERAVFIYKCDTYYNPSSESGILYLDETLDIDWEYPQELLVLSEKDKKLPTLKELYR